MSHHNPLIARFQESAIQEAPGSNLPSSFSVGGGNDVSVSYSGPADALVASFSSSGRKLGTARHKGTAGSGWDVPTAAGQSLGNIMALSTIASRLHDAAAE